MTLDKLNKLNFSLFILFLPLTALGYLYGIFHSWCQNASLYPLITGMILITIIILVAGELRTNKYAKLFFIFVVISLVSTSIMSLYIYFFIKINVGTYQEVLTSPLLRFFTTTIIFTSFYYPYYTIKNRTDLIYTLKLLDISFVLIIIYGYIQIMSLFMPGSMFYEVYMYIQKYINFAWIALNENSNKLPQIFLNGGRIMLTNQEASVASYVVQSLFYPFFLSSIITGYSIFNTKFLFFKIEPFLLIVSLPILIFTFSTSGYVVFLVQLFLSSLLYVRETKKTFITLIKILFVILVIVGVIISVYKSMEYEHLIAMQAAIDKLFLEGYYTGSSETRYGFIYAGFIEFLHYPLLGVGLGNSKYFFADYIPNWALNSEVISYMQEGVALSPKSLWTLILGETGIIGFGILIYWLFLVSKFFLKIKTDNKNSQKRLTFLKYAYILFLITFVMHGFNNSGLFFIFQWAILGFFVSVIDMIKKREI